MVASTDSQGSNMDFEWADEDLDFRRELRQFVQTELPAWWALPRPRTAGQSEYTEAECGAFVGKLAERNWLTPHWPAAYGGQDASAWQHIILGEELWSVGEPRGPQYMSVNWIGPAIMMAGTEEQKQKYLGPIARGEIYWCQGFSEPDAGNDLANLRTTAVRDGDEYVVNGSKIWISSAHLATWGLFLLRTDPTAIERGKKHEGITAFIINLHTPGIEVRPIRDMAGEELFNEIFFTDVRIPASWRLGDEGAGWMVAMGTLGYERVGIASQISILSADLRPMVEAARSVNPGALEDPSLRDRIATVWTEIELARLLSLRALSKIMKGEKNWPEVPFAKLSWSSMAQTLAELAVDLLGPAGALARGGTDAVDRGKWTRLYAFQRYSTIGGGSTEIQKNIIADRAIAMPGKSRG